MRTVLVSTDLPVGLQNSRLAREDVENPTRRHRRRVCEDADAIRRPTDSLEWPGHVESASQPTGEESRMKMPKSLGMILVAVWLILYGILTAPFLKFSFAYSGDVLALLAVAAGVLLLLRRD
jgi:hypothetical protein